MLLLKASCNTVVLPVGLLSTTTSFGRGGGDKL
jgi:hypothetical protein